MNVQDSHITVVVCTWNRAESLRSALESLTGLVTDDEFTYDVLVVNNNSTDHTSDVVAEVAAQSAVDIRESIETKAGVVHARNRGIQDARGHWIAFFDDDQAADPNWLRELLTIAREKECRCVGGAVHLRLPKETQRDLSSVCRMLLGESVGMDSPRPYNRRVTPGAGNLMIHRSVFQDIGVFDPAYQSRGEDTNLYLRMNAAGIEAWYSPQAIIHHIIPAERLERDFFLKLSRIMSQGMAEDERQAVGRTKYPLYWIARLAHAGCVVVPKLLWSTMSGQREEVLGTRCRLEIIRGYLAEGFPLLFA